MVPLRNGWSYEGPTVGGGYPEAEQISLAYRPAMDVGFRIAAMDILDPGRGIVPSKPAAVGPYKGGTLYGRLSLRGVDRRCGGRGFCVALAHRLSVG